MEVKVVHAPIIARDTNNTSIAETVLCRILLDVSSRYSKNDEIAEPEHQVRQLLFRRQGDTHSA